MAEKKIIAIVARTGAQGAVWPAPILSDSQ